MLPGKKFTPEDILGILLQRKWIIAVSFVVCAAAAVAYAKRLPDEFRSESVIMLVPQRIPDSYVKSTVTGNIQDRVATLKEQILSRSRLEKIIVDLDLYPDLRRTRTMEDVVVRMRSNIDTESDDKESFRVSFVAREAQTAQKVAERLAALFIEQNLKDRENLATETNQFLDSQLEDAKRRLVEHEKKLEDYRRRYSGELPTQATANLQAIQNAQSQLQMLAESADRDRDRRVALERQLVEAQTPDPVVAPVTPPAAGSEESVVQSLPQQIETAKARLRVLLLRDKPDHPDVKMMQRTIRDLEAKLEAERAAPETQTVPPKVLTPAEALRQRRIRDLTAQIADIDRSLREKQAEDARLRQVIADYQARLNAVPSRESDLVELTRDYATLQSIYQTLLQKREESKIAANLERRNIGEQFRILEPARVPESPFRPRRRLIALAGAGAGMLFGLAVVALLEFLDSTFKREDEIVRLLSLPVLAVVPLVVSPLERTRRRKHRLFAGIAAGGFVLVSAAVLWKLRG